MNQEIIVENNKNKSQRRNQLIFAIAGLLVSALVIVIAILYATKVLQRSVAIHIIYPGLALNCLLNGFSMLYGKNEKIAKIDFIASAVIAVIYVIIAILSAF